MTLRRREDKNRVRRRLLQSFEKRIKRFFGEHMDFVDNVNFVAVDGRGEAHFVAQLSDFINAAVGGRVNF